MPPPRTLYEINTRLWLRRLGVASLGAVPDAALDEIARLGFDLVWLMGVWAPSAAGAEAARQAARGPLRRELHEALPDLGDEDLVASPYAVCGYELSPRLGAEADLAALRARLLRRGIGLVLDFVPNHTALDHPWARAHPERYMRPPEGPAGPDGPDGHAPPDGEGTLVETPRGPRWLYHGRDPYFPPWTDTLQLDLRRRDTRRALIAELTRVAARCDGLRCDMAMLLLSDVIARTWQGRAAEVPAAERAAGEFWAEAIDALRAARPGLLLLAEAYWGTERRLLHLGFDACYDKVLYDHLCAGDAAAARAHLAEGRGRQHRMVRFLENHDEPRAAARLAPALHRAAALCALTLPGVRLLHEGQLEGARRRVPVQLARGPEEPRDEALGAFYRALLAALRDPVLHGGEWRLLQPEPAWPGSGSHEAFLLYGWDGSLRGAGADGQHRLLAANLSPERARCRVRLALPGTGARRLRLAELLGSGPTPPGDAVTEAGGPVYLRDGDALAREGLYLELPPRTAQLLAIGPER